jgi:hypothetical protein
MPTVVVLRAAVDSRPATRPLYSVVVDGLPVWAGGMASFDRAQILRQDYLFPSIERLMREIPVACITFADVLDAHPAATAIDLL